MKNKSFISAFIFIIFISTSNMCSAEQTMQFSQNVIPMNPIMSNLDKMKQEPHHQKHFTKEEMEKKRAEFEKRLNLTEEQKNYIEINKEKDREKIKPIIKKIHKKRIDYMMLETNQEIDEESKIKQKKELKNEIKELKLQADNCRKENMKNFEAILTEEQKIEFEKIKAEQKQEMEKRRKEFLKQKNNNNLFPKLF